MRSVSAGASARPSRRRGVLAALLVALLVAVPILEVWLLIQVGQALGVLPTIGILVGEAALGAWLMRREGSRAYAALTGAFDTGRMPTLELADAALVLVGGVLLMLPGFATDLVGLCCLLPFTRPVARRLLGYVVGRRIQRLGPPAYFQPLDRLTVIPGETVAEPPNSFRPRPEDPEVIIGEVEDGLR